MFAALSLFNHKEENGFRQWVYQLRNEPNTLELADSYRSCQLLESETSHIAAMGTPRKSKGIYPVWNGENHIPIPSLRFGWYALCASRAQESEGKLRARFKTGSVVFDKHCGTWRLLQWVDGKRRSQTIGTKRQYPTKKAAQEAAAQLQPVQPSIITSLTVSKLIEFYRKERMPQRFSTRYSYDQWLTNHVIPKWGEDSITDLQPRDVELWLHSLSLSPKSRVHIRGVLQQLWEFAMWRGEVPTQRNPMELVVIRGATKRTNPPRSLTFEEFQKFVAQLSEPFRTMSLLCLCLGLRISECLALKWADVDWLTGKISVERGIVRQRVSEVKTTGSRKRLSIDGTLLEVLKAWKQISQFSNEGDWIFSSPVQLGRLPWSYPRVWGIFQKAAEAAKVGKLATHTMRHSYRSWLDAVGTPIAVQQKLMRHADVRTTMNVYGDIVTDQESEAHSKIVGLALQNA